VHRLPQAGQGFKRISRVNSSRATVFVAMGRGFVAMLATQAQPKLDFMPFLCN
jgi:hypothetical protein